MSASAPTLGGGGGAAANRAANPEAAAWVDQVRAAFPGATVTYLGPARAFARRITSVRYPGHARTNSGSNVMHQQTAAARGHTQPILAESTDYDLDGWIAPEAELDGIFEMTCSDTGDLLEVRGWLFTVTLNPDDAT